ncbi:hypothetical protein BHM03_00062850, partial [Ensete ventricosum]
VLVGGENLVRVDFYGENVMEKLLNGLVATLLKSFYARFAVPVCTGISRFGWYGMGGPCTGKPSDRYVPPVPGGMENLALNHISLWK